VTLQLVDREYAINQLKQKTLNAKKARGKK